METKQNHAAYRILRQGGEGEISEKKSRFIAALRPVETEEEAEYFIAERRKKYWDARHHCFAYIIGSRAEKIKFSDDGEPGGTAGKPMLEVLSGEGLCNVAAVVTRYFGGTLLGTGGLVRAYTRAVQEGLKQSETAWMRYGIETEFLTDYNGVGKILYLLGKRELQPLDAEYTDAVKIRVLIPEPQWEELVKEITQATNGKCKMSVKQGCYYVDKDS